MSSEIKRRNREKAHKHYWKRHERSIERARAYYVAHRERANASCAKYYRANRQQILEQKEIRKFGETRQAIIARFGAHCGCCGATTPKTKRGWQVDHDHATGQVRGILCFTCNTGIGKLGDSVEGLERAIAYLRRGK